MYISIYTYICIYIYMWRRLMGCLKLQVIFHKRATNYRVLLRKMTYTDKASYWSSPPCTLHITFKPFLNSVNRHTQVGASLKQEESLKRNIFCNIHTQYMQTHIHISCNIHTQYMQTHMHILHGSTSIHTYVHIRSHTQMPA